MEHSDRRWRRDGRRAVPQGAVPAQRQVLLKRRRSPGQHFQFQDTKIALKFWKGKLTQTKRASAMNGLLANFNQNHEIYADTTDMAIFFD